MVFKTWMTRQVRHVHFREEPCRGLAFPRHRFEGSRGDFGRELQTGPWSHGRWSWERCQLAWAEGEESGSSKKWADAISVTFSSSGFLPALRFCSPLIQHRICLPITEDVICHVFVYSLLAYARKTLTYFKHGSVFVYTYVCSLWICDHAQGQGGGHLNVSYGAFQETKTAPGSSLCDEVMQKGHGGFAKFDQKMPPVN